MSRFLMVFIASFLWSLPVSAHVPEVGERSGTGVICNESAHDELVDHARTVGIKGMHMKLYRAVNSSRCWGIPKSMVVHITGVQESFDTPDGFIFYPLRVRPEGYPPTPAWYAAHTHKIEGEPI